MKKELEILKVCRALIGARAEKLAEGIAIDVEVEIRTAGVLFNELVRMGMLQVEDVDLVFRLRMDLAGTPSTSDPQMRLILEGILKSRFSAPNFCFSDIHLSQIPPYVPELISFLLEMAEYESVRKHLTQSVDFFNHRAKKMRRTESGEKVSRLVKFAYRRLDPKDILVAAERTISDERKKVLWAKRQLKKENGKSGSALFDASVTEIELKSPGSEI